MTNALSLGQYVFFGSRKALVIERDGLYVTVVVFDRDGQHIMEHVPSRVFTIVARNIRRRLGQTARGAMVEHVFGRLPMDRATIAAGLFALAATAAMLAAFIASIAGRWPL